MLPLLADRPDVRVTVVADPDETGAHSRAGACAGRQPDADWRAALACQRPRRRGRDLADCAPCARPRWPPSRAGSRCTSKSPWPRRSKRPPRCATPGARPASPSPSGSTRGSIPCSSRCGIRCGTGASATLRLMRCAFTVAARYEGSWRHHAAEGGGVLYDLASHQVDLARYLLRREIVRVSATRATSADGETVAVTGEIDGGVLLSATWASGAIDDEVVEVVGTEGALRLARYEDLTLTRRGQSVPGAAARLMRAVPTPQAAAFGLARRRSPWHDPSFAAALDHFVRAARSGTRRCLASTRGGTAREPSTPLPRPSAPAAPLPCSGDGRPDELDRRMTSADSTSPPVLSVDSSRARTARAAGTRRRRARPAEPGARGWSWCSSSSIRMSHCRRGCRRRLGGCRWFRGAPGPR